MNSIKLKPLVLAVMFTVQLMLTCCVFATEPVSVNERIEKDYAELEAEGVTKHILGEEFFAGENVSRGEFAAAVVRSFGLTGGATEAGYKDVTPATAFYDEICVARESKIISEAEYFNPDADINYTEAVKMMVVMIGYGYMAETKGGYPSGYIQAARRAELIEGTAQTSAPLDTKVAKKLIFNLLTSNVSPIGVADGITIYTEEGRNCLYSVHNLMRTEGIVTETDYNSYKAGQSVSDRNKITVNQTEYTYSGATPELLGKNVCIYYDCTSKEAKLLLEIKNSEVVIKKSDIKDISDGTVTYYSGNRQLSSDIAGARYVYNGSMSNKKADEEWKNENWKGDYTYIRLLNNDNDKVIEYIYVYDYSYIYAEKVDYLAKTMTDANVKTNTGFMPQKNDASYFVTDAEGKSIEFEDLTGGNLFAIAQSYDGEIVTVRTLSSITEGAVKSIKKDRSGEFVELCINDVWYEISPYAKRNYKYTLGVCENGIFGLGLGGEVVTVSVSDGSVRYGYLVDAANLSEALTDNVKLRILTTAGKIEMFDAEKVSFDENSTRLKGDAIITALGGAGNVTPQLIRYKTNDKGMVVHIDLATAATASDDPSALVKNPDNSLMFYSFEEEGSPKTIFTYRSGGRSCSPYFNLNNTRIFAVPLASDIKSADDECFLVADYSMLVSGRDYEFRVFDLDENGSAGAVVIEIDDSKTSWGKFTQSGAYMVESARTVVIPNGELGKKLYVYGSGGYEEFYLEAEKEKRLGIDIAGGDIIELVANNSNNTIKTVSQIISGSGAVPVRGPKVSADKFRDIDKISYWEGYLYSSNGQYGYLADNVTDDYTKRINLRIDAKTIAVINKNRDEIRPITALELKDYRTLNAEGYYVVVRSNAQNPMSVFAYEY